MKKNISYFLFIFWLFVIFFLSHQSGAVSGNESGGFLYQIFNFIYQIFDINTANLKEFIELIHNPFREMMHMVEYLILAILLINVLKQKKSKEKIIVITILFGFIYATTDEIHQIFIPGRTFEYFDIMMDMIGTILGSLIGNKIIKTD